MNGERYLEMSSEELYPHLIETVMVNLSEGKILIEHLEKTERYQEDYAFRITIGTVKGIVLGIERKNGELFLLCTNLIEQATALKMWQLVSINWNTIGNGYFAIGAFERAIECYHHVIQTEKKYHLLNMTSVTYNNIALNYLYLEDYEKTYEYMQLAIEALEKGGTDHQRYPSRLVFYLGYLVISLCSLNRLDEIPILFERMWQIDMNKINPSSISVYRIAQIHYAFSTSDYAYAKQVYYQEKEQIPPHDSTKRLDFLKDYLKLCQKFHLDYSFYREDLLDIESISASNRMSVNVELYTMLRKYYQDIGDQEKFEKTTDRYIEFLEKNTEDIRMRRLDSLKVVENLIWSSENIEALTSNNQHLKWIAEEALRDKNTLEATYHRIEMINELGRKLTSSLNLAEVVDLIYSNLKKNLPLRNFILMAAEPELDRLRSVAYYENDELCSEFCIALDEEDSLFAECYRKNQLILSKDIQEDPHCHGRRVQVVGEEENDHSFVFMPLNVGSRLIGVCSLQDERRAVYTQKHIAFLEELLPYLSIALNNAIRSQSLEKEIQSHLQTQKKLQKVNQRLSHLSSCDVLTQISNRRDFEKRMKLLLEEVQKQQREISLFMFDIDNFKLYNDNYGHLEGDEALKKVAQSICRSFDQVGGLSARFGGEEFIGICTGLDAMNSRALAESVRKEVYDLAIKHPMSPLGRLSVSVGVAVAERVEISDRCMLMRKADSALYYAKNTGKNKVVVIPIEAEEYRMALKKSRIKVSVYE